MRKIVTTITLLPEDREYLNRKGLKISTLCQQVVKQMRNDDAKIETILKEREQDGLTERTS